MLALDHLPARPYVVNFWASWCEPCQREAPRLAAAAAAMGGRVAFLGVDTQDDRDSALKFLHRFGVDYPQLVDPAGDVLYRLPAPGLPVTVAVDASGRVVYRRLGEISATQLTAALNAADPTRPVTSGSG
jgi:thiol-disulfide isomerase/thioredoxin